MLTDRQRKLFDFLCAYVKAHDGKAPSYNEMVEGTGIGRNAVHEAMRGMEARGIIRRAPKQARAIEILRWRVLPPSNRAEAVSLMARVMFERPTTLRPRLQVGAFDRVQGSNPAKMRAIADAEAAFDALAAAGLLGA